jgi:hypothetical protein
MLTWSLIVRVVWTAAKWKFAMLAPVLATALLISAVVELATPGAGHPAGNALLASASAVVLLIWVKAIAMPLLTKGKLPDGRDLGNIVARRRMRREGTRARRQAHRERRGSETGPNVHRRTPKDDAGRAV